MVKVKVRCIASPEELRLAYMAGAAAVGLVAAMPSGPGHISEEAIREITASCPPGL